MSLWGVLRLSIQELIGPPLSRAELLERAHTLTGKTIQKVADSIGHRVPLDTTRAKGWVGQLVEDALGAAAGNRAVPDFEFLGVELKTVPVDVRGAPSESTYVTTVPPDLSVETVFSSTSLMKKLECVLFVPVEADQNLPLNVRRFGAPLLWLPTETDRHTLESDWQTFAAYIARGELDAIGPELGEVLQIRPKGSDKQDRTLLTRPDGQVYDVMRRGFYLRPRFVQALFTAHFHMPFHSSRDRDGDR